jgi:murein DD-endopeptidase MepM/ murein hydrolase activator NlpD
MFFDNNVYFRYLAHLRNAGITIPVIAGIMPVTNGRQIERICKLSGSTLPPRFRAIVDRFGEKYHPVYKNVKLPSNNGVDIALPHGAKVCSVFKGVVRQIVVMPGYNKCVLVQHGNHFTFYCKLGNVFVKAGDKVDLGEQLGTVDTINGQTLLHFQVWQSNKPQNPEIWLK